MHVLSSVSRAMGLGMASAVLTLAVAARAGDTAEEKKPAKPVPLEGGGAQENPSAVWHDVPMDPWGIATFRAGRLSEYWLGVVSQSPLPEPLRAHLRLPANQGLLVVEVAPHSPAAAAKLQRFDVLLKAGGRSLGKIDDLMDALDVTKGQKMILEILREGQPRKIEVTPAKRPPEARPKPRDWAADLLPGGADPWEHLKEWFEKAQPGGPGKALRFRVLRPGVLLPPGAPVPGSMPGDMTIAITKQGNQPAKVVVTQGDKKWETTDDHLEKLPAEVRPHVERLLDRPAIGAGRPGTLDWIPGWGGAVAVPGELSGTKARQDLEERIAKAREEFRRIQQESRKMQEEVRNRLDELEKKWNELKAPGDRRPLNEGLKPPPKKPPSGEAEQT